MTITPNWNGLGLLAVFESPIDLEAATLKLALFTDAYTPNRDTDDLYSGLSNELANGNGYTTGGVTLTGVATSYDATSDQIRLDFADPTWTFTAAKTWRHGVIYDSGTSKIIAVLTWDSNQTVSTAYTLQIDAAGLLYIDIS